eukprot:CAMPEP_0198137758 /NCGR_PEP_ID=MMETSP1443-20131203/1220_1 /TAXON_ID=186043 /ORGANISM="Entomoneis sp., Strain CCMP2396" /LENGTH=193 /DNA_ID=CAMNT_0043799291 /DNA_START=5 /DNA_END=586 /DNA_ORIENTATION=+
MVVFILDVKADLEKVASLAIAAGSTLCVSVRNPLNDYEIREKIVIDTSELEPEEEDITVHHPGRVLDTHDRVPPHHFALKWPDEKKKSTIRVLNGTEALPEKKSSKKKGKQEAPASLPTREMVADDSGNFVPILALECEGLEPYAFHPMGNEFIVTGSDGTQYKEVDLSEGAWSEFEMATGSTSITNFETKFE